MALRLPGSCPRGCFHLVVLGVGAFRVVLRRVPVFAAGDSGFRRGITSRPDGSTARLAEICFVGLFSECEALIFYHSIRVYVCLLSFILLLSVFAFIYLFNS